MKFFFLALFIFSGCQAFSSAFPEAGAYTGFIHMDKEGLDVPVSIALSYSDEEVSASPDELAPFKRKIEGAFVLDREGGPYSFTLVNYDLGLGTLDLQYFRNNSGVGAPSLRFLGDYRVQYSKSPSLGTVSGQVFSGLHTLLGTFKVQKTDGAQVVTQNQIYVGKFAGTFTYSDPSLGVVPLTMTVGTTSEAKTNPPDFELDFTSGHLGGFVFDAWDSFFTSIYIDYLRQTIQLNYEENSRILTFTGHPTETGMTGVATSSGKAMLGIFEMKRVK